MLRGQYEVAQIAGSSLASAIKRAVATFQLKHGGQLPQYVWCPEGERPDAGTVQSWAVRGVTVAPHRSALGGVFAGPVDGVSRPHNAGEVAACQI